MTNGKLIRLSLRLWGEDLDPDEVTRSIGLAPTRSYRKGYTKELSSGEKTAPKKLGMWGYEKISENSFETDLADFVDEFKGKDLFSVEGVQIAILDLYFNVSDENSALLTTYEYRLESSAMKLITSLGADVRITIC